MNFVFAFLKKGKSFATFLIKIKKITCTKRMLKMHFSIDVIVYLIYFSLMML